MNDETATPRGNPTSCPIWLARLGLYMGLFLAVGCGSQSSHGHGAGEPAAPGPLLAVMWSITTFVIVSTTTTELGLLVTDETGSTQVENGLLTVPGRCKDTSLPPSERADMMLALRCTDGDRAVEIRLRRYGAALIVLRAPVEAGRELSFEEAARVSIPEDAVVEAR